MKSKLLCLALVAMLIAPVFAQDEAKPKKKKGQEGKAAAAQSASAQLLKQLEVVKLTEEQVAKIKAMGKTAEAEIKKIQGDAGLTAAVLKKRREATASMKDSELKGKKKAAAINEAAGINEAQVAALAKVNEVRAKLKADALKLLTAEQKEKLPDALKAGRAGKAGGKKAGAAKKKDVEKKDAAE